MNPAILSPYASQNWDALNGAQYALLQAQLAKVGRSPDKYYFLAPSLCGSDRRFKVQEKRKAEWVEFLNIAYAAGVDPSTLPDLEGCDTLIYKNIALEDSALVAATAVIDPAGANNSLTFTADTPGALGNDISIQYFDPGGATATLGVTVVGKLILVSLGRAASAINTTATALKSAIDANPTAAALVNVANTSPDTGAGLVTAMPRTFLEKGQDIWPVP
jgi:hypothetical protein